MLQRLIVQEIKHVFDGQGQGGAAVRDGEDGLEQVVHEPGHRIHSNHLKKHLNYEKKNIQTFYFTHRQHFLHKYNWKIRR